MNRILLVLTLLWSARGGTVRGPDGQVCMTNADDITKRYNVAVCNWRTRCDAWTDEQQDMTACLVRGGDNGGGFISRPNQCLDGCLIQPCLEALDAEPCEASWPTDLPECRAIVLAALDNVCEVTACNDDAEDWCWDRQAAEIEAMKAGG